MRFGGGTRKAGAFRPRFRNAALECGVGAASFGARFLLGVDLGVDKVRLRLRDGVLGMSLVSSLRAVSLSEASSTAEEARGSSNSDGDSSYS